MIMKKESVFRVGERVFNPCYGWGDILKDFKSYLIIKYDSISTSRMVFPKEWVLLSFTEYELNANQVRPFEHGDVVQDSDGYGYTTICRGVKDDGAILYDIYMKNDRVVIEKEIGVGLGYARDFKLATDTQKQLLFDMLKRDGKRWNAETKRLEDLNEPKVGDDVIIWSKGNSDFAVISVLSSIRKDIVTSYYPDGLIYNGRYGNCIKWDGTKEQFNRIREGGKL